MLSIIGASISSIALLYGLYLLIKTLAFGKDLPGYASTIIILLFLGGIIELSIGIIGEYLARIFTEVKQRPIYIEKESNLDKDKDKNCNEKSDK
jgi:glycosyltransferase involved in cell wall biosynthesis